MGFGGLPTCWHKNATDPDPDGDRVCLDCGAHMPGLESNMRRAVALIYRDFGRYGRHSLRCVQTDVGWCCADDCELRPTGQAH